MLRITVRTEPAGATLLLEGRLAGPLVAEVERCWQAACERHRGKPLAVDLQAVTYIDAEGKAWLKRAYERGADLVAAGCLTRAYVEDITRRR